MSIEPNLFGEMREFFDNLPEYAIAEDEEIEVIWAPRGNDLGWNRQRVANLDQTASMAVALGPDHNIRILVMERADDGDGSGRCRHPLASWEHRERRSEDHYAKFGLTLTSLVYPPGKGYGLAVQHFPDGGGTCEAITFTHADRPWKPVRHQRTRSSDPALGNRQGESH